LRGARGAGPHNRSPTADCFARDHSVAIAKGTGRKKIVLCVPHYVAVDTASGVGDTSCAIAVSATAAMVASYAVNMTIFSPRTCMSANRGKLNGLRADGGEAGGRVPLGGAASAVGDASLGSRCWASGRDRMD
jgi:hypothetical protein